MDSLCIPILAIWFASGVVGNLLVFAMVHEVNARLPEHQKFSMFWWYPPKGIRLWRQHRDLFPHSNKRIWLGAMLVAVYGGVFVLPGICGSLR